MKNGEDYFCFTVIGKPVTKKRARITTGRFTENSWYEKMIEDAFKLAYPNSKPIGHEFYEIGKRKFKGKEKYVIKLRKGIKDEDLPSIKFYMIVYVNEGKVGDVDNYQKIVLDGLNTVMYMDDRMIRALHGHVIFDEYEEERIEVLAIKSENMNIEKLKDFIDNHSKVIDIYDNYEMDRLHEFTVSQLKNKFCKNACAYFDDITECPVRRKDDVIFCENK